MKDEQHLLPNSNLERIRSLIHPNTLDIAQIVQMTVRKMDQKF